MKQFKANMLGKEVEIIIPNAAAYLRLKNKYGDDKYGLAKELLSLYVSPPLNIEEEVKAETIRYEVSGEQRDWNITAKQAAMIASEILRDLNNPDLLKYAEKVVTKEEIEILTNAEFENIYESIMTSVYPVAEKIGEIIIPFRSI